LPFVVLTAGVDLPFATGRDGPGSKSESSESPSPSSPLETVSAGGSVAFDARVFPGPQGWGAPSSSSGVA
jgi:hypothetical protein